MKTETADWLAPMLESDEQIDPDEFMGMIRSSMFPAREAPSLDRLRSLTEHLTTATPMALNWIRFGQLLRERLGWDDYPPLPKEEEVDRWRG